MQPPPRYQSLPYPDNWALIVPDRTVDGVYKITYVGGPLSGMREFLPESDVFRWFIMSADQRTALQRLRTLYTYAPPANETLSCCDHSYKHYVGFSESYEYCTKCDGKRI